MTTRGQFRTAGLDLASQNQNTALAVLAWSPGAVVVEHLQVDVSNREIVAVSLDVDLLGIDCPLGWPASFTDLLIAQRAGSVASGIGADDESRRMLAYRHTDLLVRERSGRWPLSVSADRIAYPAMRSAGLLAALREGGRSIRRSGVESAVAEVYPAAALRAWGLTSRGYKRSSELTARLVDELTAAAPWLDLVDGVDLCRACDDALDAVIAALNAGAVVLGRTLGPDAPDLLLADEEGWIHLPDNDFLVDPWLRKPMASGHA